MHVILTILGKEVSAFYNTLTGYLVMVVFLVGMGLFFWIFPDNVLENGVASLDTLFAMAPWFLLFVVPAITMRAFAEEYKTGTIEFLATKPLTDMQILLGKYLGALVLIVASILPTLTYYVTVWYLGFPPGNLDTGATWGAYMGLLGIGAIYAAIGLWCSATTDNQIVAYVLGVFLCFFFYTAFDFLSELAWFGSFNDLILQLGMLEHYRSISRGVLDVRDILYFLSLITLFLLLGRAALAARKK
jgi:ABC-2 type transport system permease protein